jgi:hypothetical protein
MPEALRVGAGHHPRAGCGFCVSSVVLGGAADLTRWSAGWSAFDVRKINRRKFARRFAFSF